MHDLFAVHLRLRLPARIAILGSVAGNQITGLAHDSHEIELHFIEANARGRRYWKATANNGRTFAIVDFDTTSQLDCDAVLKVSDISTPEAISCCIKDKQSKWVYPKPTKPAPKLAEATANWKDKLRLMAEEFEGSTRTRLGLRPPQLGALYAVKAHWSVSNQPATVVLPTGSGKTDTMVALLVSEPTIACLLVVVPTDPLRRQIGRKFMTMDVLKKAGLVPPDLEHPVVTFLSKGPKSRADIDAIVSSSNVVVATMSVINAMNETMRGHLAQSVSHLFIDEAHHIGAKTWKGFKALFSGKSILQFTATPFRNDGRRVDGKFIYVYPLRRAQEDGLFTAIKYVPLSGSNEQDTDRQIIESVGRQLEEDLAHGFHHLAMARTDGVDRARALHKLYCKALPQHKPQLIHNEIPPKERKRQAEAVQAFKCQGMSASI
ncbi:hypothetical protein A1D31_37750 [Bradyrhizobium liaoningense]|nr:hypothetical protein A1D31_37750 [Bradyrhizobium liaoningense]